MPSWSDPAMQKRLLLAILASNESITFKPAEIQKLLGDDTITPKAVTHQIPKVKAMVESLKTGNYTDDAPASVNKAPQSPGKRARAMANGDDDGDESPSKKSASKMKKTKKTINTLQVSGDTKSDSGKNSGDRAKKEEED